jgi:hypothetical protein
MGREASQQGWTHEMLRWWHELTGLLARRRDSQTVARRLRTYVATEVGR